jgi:hypothetical protein
MIAFSLQLDAKVECNFVLPAAPAQISQILIWGGSGESLTDET